jgi:hypothetical protein
MQTVARKTWNEPVYGTTGSDGTTESASAKFAGYVEHVNDIKLDRRGNIMMYENAEAVADRVDAAIKTHLGELQLNTEMGVPYETTIFKHRKYAQTWVSKMREAILDDDEVESIESFEYEIDGDKLTYKVVFTTTYGTTESVTNG